MPASLVEDYYALLGVQVTVSEAELRRAWRRLALQWHPDLAGEAATATFQRMSVAYAVLSDPLKRAVYDRRRRAAEAAGKASREATGNTRTSESGTARQDASESGTARRGATSTGEASRRGAGGTGESGTWKASESGTSRRGATGAGASGTWKASESGTSRRGAAGTGESGTSREATRAEASGRRAAPGTLLTRASGPLASLIACGAARVEEAGVITLVLREDEAAQGGMVTVSMPVDVWCPDCAATEADRVRVQGSAEECGRCERRRTVRELYSAWLAVPPGVASGEVLAPSVGLPGQVAPVRFRVRLRGA